MALTAYSNLLHVWTWQKCACSTGLPAQAPSIASHGPLEEDEVYYTSTVEVGKENPPIRSSFPLRNWDRPGEHFRLLSSRRFQLLMFVLPDLFGQTTQMRTSSIGQLRTANGAFDKKTDTAAPTRESAMPSLAMAASLWNFAPISDRGIGTGTLTATARLRRKCTVNRPLHPNCSRMIHLATKAELAKSRWSKPPTSPPRMVQDRRKSNDTRQSSPPFICGGEPSRRYVTVESTTSTSQPLVHRPPQRGKPQL